MISIAGVVAAGARPGPAGEDVAQDNAGNRRTKKVVVAVTDPNTWPPPFPSLGPLRPRDSVAGADLGEGPIIEHRILLNGKKTVVLR